MESYLQAILFEFIIILPALREKIGCYNQLLPLYSFTEIGTILKVDSIVGAKKLNAVQ
jgi:hypothetical protein